jgi:type I site-specific restriction endonuclease
VLGVTATPKRGDHTDVTDLFETVSSEYTLYQAIKDGWLSPIKVQTCPLSIDVSKCEMQSGDYAVGDIGKALYPYLSKIADEIIEKAKGRKTIIFVPLVSTAKGMVEIFKEKGVASDYVAGERKDSDKVLKAYHNGEFNILINSLLLCEGYDEPSISCVVNLRLTKSEALYTQIIGRGTRLAEGKEDLLVLDFLWKDKENRKHLNAKSCIAMGDESIRDEDLEQVVKSCEAPDEEPTDVFEGIERAKQDAKEIRENALARALAEANANAKKTQAMQEQREAQLRALSEAKSEIIENGTLVNVNKNLSIIYDKGNQMVLCSIVGDKAIEDMGLADYYPMGLQWEAEPPTEAQMTRVQKLGFPATYIASKGHCSFIMNALFEREKEGLCSYKQLKMLSRYKLGDLSRCTHKMASKGMDILVRNHWKPTGELYALFNQQAFSEAPKNAMDDIVIE